MVANDVLSFWFEEIDQSRWWTKDSEFDETISRRFMPTIERAKKCELFSWRDSAKGRLAEIIVLDQFSRNVFRDKPEAFAADPLALALAQEAVLHAKHLELSGIERTFLLMPYMHSESLQIHDIAVTLFKENGIQSNVDFEMAHRKIIQQFGRYPHRNEILNRESTEEEKAFLTQPGSSF